MAREPAGQADDQYERHLGDDLVLLRAGRSCNIRVRSDRRRNSGQMATYRPSRNLPKPLGTMNVGERFGPRSTPAKMPRLLTNAAEHAHGPDSGDRSLAFPTHLTLHSSGRQERTR